MLEPVLGAVRAGWEVPLLDLLIFRQLPLVQGEMVKHLHCRVYHRGETDERIREMYGHGDN